MSNMMETNQHTKVVIMDASVDKFDPEGKTDAQSMGTGDAEFTLEDQERERLLEKRLKWKIDFTILPMLALAYFLSSMARSDLANAKTAGMIKELGMSPKQYSNASSMFNVGYILFQIPGTILVRKLGPPRQFAGAILLWGLVTICHIWTKNYATLMGLRFLVGSIEAFLEGGTFYISFWYTFREMVKRGAIFYSSSAIAGSFNGLIAYGIESNLAGKHGWNAWQWLFFVEGMLPIGCSFLFLILLPPTPEQGHFTFTKAEKELAIRRSRRSFNPVDARIRPALILSPLKDVKFWLLTAVYSFNHFSVASLSNFLPSIIQGFGLSSVRSQLMSVLVYACALVGILFFGFLADKMDRRGIPLLVASSVACLGFILLLALTGYEGRMAGACILASGIYATIPISTTWLSINIAGYTKRGASTAMMNMIAQAVSIAGNQAYIDPPLYRKGLGSSLAITVAHMLSVCAMLYAIKRAKAKKAKLRSELSPEQLAERRAESWDIVGDDHIDFEYGY